MYFLLFSVSVAPTNFTAHNQQLAFIEPELPNTQLSLENLISDICFSVQNVFVSK